MTPESSLDRFLSQRGPTLLSGAWRRNNRANLYVGGSLLAFGAVFLGVALANYPAAAPGAIGPLLAGAINLGVHFAMRRGARNRPVPAALTSDAKILLSRLVRLHAGWGSGYHYWGPTSVGHHGLASKRAAMEEWRAQMGQIGAGPWLNALGLGAKSAQEVLSEPVFAVLESAAFQYNRVVGLLASGDDRLGKIVMTVQTAIDEAIADVFHQAAMLEQFPESSGSARKVCEDRTASLREIADRVEALQRREPTLTERLSYTSAVDEALEELRLQTMAESELLRNEKNTG